MRLGNHFEDFVKVVAAAYGLAAFDQFLLFNLDQRREMLAASGTLLEVITNVALKAEQEGWIQGLVLALRVDRSTVPELVDVMNRIVSDWNGGARPAADPFSTFFTNKGGIVDRERSRAALKDMQSVGGRRVMLLRGEANTGKTYTWHFLKTVSDRLHFPSIYVNLVRWSEGATPLELMVSIASQLDATLTPTFDAFAREPRKVTQLVDWFTGELRRRGSRCWIFFDHLDKAIVRPEALGLITELVRSACDDVADLRVVIAGLPRDSDMSPFDPVEESPPGVKREDVARFFRAIAQQESGAIDEVLVGKAVERVYEPPADPPGAVVSPMELTRRLREVAFALFEGLES
jgi:hypothetical protein